MQLKSIEINGFKSFADKTKIDFPKGMTGIVGPNGSGKSNIAESIRWVLGEQSAKSLRGNKMPDVIFSGSADRSQENMATVNLVLDNSDHYIDNPFNELKITRKLFRDGESSYLINDQECRLKDITNLFMDSGIGQGSLSIISQGNVEAIFNSKPTERRSVFENVAGVYKFKQQKRSAEMELTKTADNLDRISDIIHEIKTQLGPLEEQSSLAKDYLDQKDKLDKLEKQHLIINFDQFSKDFEKSSANVEKNTQIVAQIQDSIDGFDEQRNSLKKEITNNLNLIDQLSEDYLKISESIQAKKSHHQLSVQQKEFLIQQKDELVQRQSSLENQLKELNAGVDRFSTQENSVQQNLDQLLVKRQVCLQNIQDLEKRQFDQEIEQLRTNYVDTLQDQSDIKNKIMMADRDSKQTIDQISSRNSHLEDLKTELTKVSNQADKQKDVVSKFAEQATLLNSQIKSQDEHQEELKKQIESSRKSWLAALKIAEETKAKKRSLQNIVDSHRGYYYGVSNLLKHKDQLKGIAGPVADYLKIPPKFVKAIDTALGSQSQYVIVKDNQSASLAIKFLTQNRMGRVTLLPVSTIQSRKIGSEVLSNASKEKGFVGIASTLIKINPKLKNISEFLLGTVIIADNLDNAILISKKIYHRARIVTLDGQIVNTGGSLTGGANKNQTKDVLVQKSELETLANTIVTMDEKLSAKESELKNSQANLDKFQSQTENLKQKLTDLNRLYQSAKLRFDSLQKDVNDYKKQVKVENLSIKNIKHERLNEDSVDTLKDQNKRVSEKLANINKQISNLQMLSDQTQEKIKNFEKVSENLDTQISDLKQQKSQIKGQSASLRDQIKNSLATRDQISQQIKEAQDKLDSQVESEKINLQIAKDKSKQSSISQKSTNLKATVTNKEKLLNELEEKIKVQNTNLSNTKVALNNDQSSKSAIQEKIIKTRENLINNFSLDPVKDPYELADVDVTEIKSQIKLLRMGIEEIGSVNVGAIQEFSEVSDRYEFLTKQQEDLQKAKQRLENTMNQMDSKIARRFKETFDLVSKSFSKVFVDMFGGGQARLELTDPTNLLESGIEIMVQPPGKNFRSLSLLSGGEKALTAITLLFAIIKFKPVPFCILDEAEAALDPYNADRFANYLKRFGQSTQFIVITHRKETMIYADQLYGITMQESGVSKVVAVSLDNLSKEVN